jgi:hypothetical protein
MDRATAGGPAAAVGGACCSKPRGRHRTLSPLCTLRSRVLRPVRFVAVALSFGLVALWLSDGSAPSMGLQTRPDRAPSVSAPPPRENAEVSSTYDLYQSYPNSRLQGGYVLKGTNKYRPITADSGPDQTSLWFQSQGSGAFKQFDTEPYRECHWDLLRWGQGKEGLLSYIATRAACYTNHTEIVFRPGISYMPKTWTSGTPWSDKGVSYTVYYEDDVPVCDGTNAWASRVIGVATIAGGEQAVHTQTNETQTLSPIAGAPGSSSCPPGQATTFQWQENFYLDAVLSVRGADGSVTGSDVGLARSVGGNLAAIREAGHPQWDSVFTNWELLPPANVGSLTTTTTNVASASTGNTITFTYTAPVGGISGGVLTLAVPPGWTAPVTTNSIGCTSATEGTVTTGGQAIIVSDLTLPANGQAVITYGATSGGSCAAGDGATASQTAGAPIWQAEVGSTTSGALTSLTSSPFLNVYAADGSGALTIPATDVAADSSGNTLRFTYTAPTGGMSDGTAMITVPPGWTPPVTTNAIGCTVATQGTVTTSGQTIVISDLSLAGNTSAVIIYGATAGSNCSLGDAATAGSTSGTNIFTAEEMSTAGGTLTTIAVSPTVTVN